MPNGGGSGYIQPKASAIRPMANDGPFRPFRSNPGSPNLFLLCWRTDRKAMYMRGWMNLFERTKSPQESAAPVHPIANFPDIYTPENVPYFTYSGRFRPLALNIETVNICNNDCVICPYGLQTRSRQGMDKAVFAKVVADYAAIGGGQVTLTPMVGEVLLEPGGWKIAFNCCGRLPRSRAFRRSPTPPSLIFIPTMNWFGWAVIWIVRRVGLRTRAQEFALMTRKDEYAKFKSLARLIRLSGQGRSSSGASSARAERRRDRRLARRSRYARRGR